MRAIIRRGFMAWSVAGERESFSRTPGRKGSIRMSVCGRRDLMRVRPEGDFRSMLMEDLYRVKRSVVGGGVGEEDGEECVMLGMDRSTRNTEAPASARRRPAKGPGDRV